MLYRMTKSVFSTLRRLSLSLSQRRILAGNGSSDRDSFTLIELLIVIAIIGILAAAVVLILNPSQLLSQSRDSRRIQDIANLNSAIGMYLSEGNTSLGSSDTVYVDVPDTSATCADLGLPSLPASWSYHCATTSTLRNVDGTGWIPVNFTQISVGTPLSVLPVDPVNTTSTGLYYTYVTNGSGSYELTAVALESQKYQADAENDGGQSATSYELGSSLALSPLVFPENWIQVPGNSTFGTPTFWVMKYDAKCVSGSTPLTSPDTGYHTYSNSSQNCVSPYYIASAPSGYPIANIDHTDAVTYCSNIGAHLLRNDEYMTIADSAANTASNWSGGSVGSGYLYSGHNDNAPGNALQASADDTQGYYHETNTGGNQRRTLALGNGNVIWDIAGNVWEHVQRSTNDSGDNTNTMSLPSCSNGSASWEWCEYASPGSPYVSAYTGDVAQTKIAPPNSSWYSSQGVGQMYTYGSGGNQGTSVFLRGDNWGSGSAAGAFTLSLGWYTGNAGSDVGFRCAR